MILNPWVHIRKHDLYEVLYVNGEQVLADDVLDAVKVLELVFPAITATSFPVLFTTDNIVETEDSEWDYDTMFPASLDLSGIKTFEKEEEV